MNQARGLLIQKMAMFGAISDQAVEFIVDRASTVAVAEGNDFFGEGGERTAVFVLEQGPRCGA